MATRLDVLTRLGERKRVEEEAPAFVRPHTYLGPFALRALGCVRGDRELLEQAVAPGPALAGTSGLASFC
jgi:hypothetical protein